MCIIVSEQCYYEIGLFYYAYDFVGIAGRNNFNSWYYKVSYYDKVIYDILYNSKDKIYIWAFLECSEESYPLLSEPSLT